MSSRAKPLRQRVLASLAARADLVRSSPVFSPTVLQELLRERTGGHPVTADHEIHLRSAIQWLERAQDATPDDGLARGYSLTRNRYFGAAGWQPSYPETTGYIIPTLYEAGRRFGRVELSARAERAARWEVEIQLPTGAVRGGVMGQPESPAIFNTGQVIFGWLAAYLESGDPIFAEATARAGRYLVEVMDDDGHWRKDNSRFARRDTTLYNARVAWALAEAGDMLNEPGFSRAASRNLAAVVELQQPNGWLPRCCLSDPNRPLLHTLAYATRGLLEGGNLLGDAGILAAAQKSAATLQRSVRPDGRMAGRFYSDWTPAVSSSCLTGQAQMANIWLRLYQLTGDEQWLETVEPVLNFLKSTQNCTTAHEGLRGAIKGSYPLAGDYGPYVTLNWAVKFFADALMRDDVVRKKKSESWPKTFDLA